MALVKCRECAAEISTSAKKCPQCGSSTPTSKHATAKIIAAVIAILFFLWWAFGGGAVQTGAPMMSSIEDKVANDAVAQYNIAKKQGDKMQICVQAGMVSAAYLQAKDEGNYNTWKATQSSDCAAAGLPQQ